MVVRGKEPDVDDIFDNAPGAVAENAEVFPPQQAVANKPKHHPEPKVDNPVDTPDDDTVDGDDDTDSNDGATTGPSGGQKKSTQGRPKGKPRKSSSMDPRSRNGRTPVRYGISPRQVNQARMDMATIRGQLNAAYERVALAERKLQVFKNNLRDDGFGDDLIEEITAL